MNFINTFFDGLIHLLYPANCCGCGTDVLTGKQLLCAECTGQLPYTNFHQHAVNPVEKVFRGRLPVSFASSFLYFTKLSLIQTIMHQLKYKGRKDLGVYMGRLMGEAFRECPFYHKVDVLIPLPLHWKKEKLRGFNQAQVLCEGISSALQIPVVTDAVQRNSLTRTQTRMNRVERWDNMKGQFKVVKSEKICGRHILLIDDVITTGATLEACGREILQVDGVNLSIGSLAYTSA